MYKLLLATNRPEILNAFEAVSSWEGMGFRRPRIASSAEEAIDILSRHHVDGIAYALDSKDEWALHYHLRDNYLILPIFEAASTHADVMRSITELRSLLNRLRSDYSDDNTSAQDMLQICRHDFFRALLGGRVHGRKEVITHLQLLRKIDQLRRCHGSVRKSRMNMQIADFFHCCSFSAFSPAFFLANVSKSGQTLYDTLII